MKSLINISVLAFFLTLVSCTSKKTTDIGNGPAPSHQVWDELLKEYVNEYGFIDYKGIISEKVKFESYLELLSNNPPANSWNKSEKLAYWINVYNAFTVKLIIDNYPIESIKDLNPTLSIPTVHTVWTKDFFKIGEEDFNLDRVEHKILRVEFEEPRIHFAINCASFSCPVLRPEAFKAEKIERQLEEQARAFINDSQRNKITKDKVELSKIFSWFGGDFKKDQSLIQFLNKYSEVKINDNAAVDFMDYQWSLNDASKK
ncbi:hypothetical protein MB14_12660 [Roseivirga ehrenbergii]|uniref:DUF547 domain-containing protein n=2 Tax=Roseivirga ehrenbergii (strain DSM 102268 / JCM 13514 / KCTC 12282 / NCIMB 14502 / KMM 6017) TaxID=279360 RepID=A0A150XRW6_ROSEK|nr:DUF547 domain-containing protein [Roseivirga ehrenbergii]KYG81441.1 hypothetical protein MB14_12660 [Roseivirga ehrenbergii]